MAEKSTNSNDLQDLLSDALEELKCNDVEADQPSTSKNSKENSAELTGKVSFEETLKMMNERLLQANAPNFKVPEESCWHFFHLAPRLIETGFNKCTLQLAQQQATGNIGGNDANWYITSRSGFRLVESQAEILSVFGYNSRQPTSKEQN